MTKKELVLRMRSVGAVLNILTESPKCEPLFYVKPPSGKIHRSCDSKGYRKHNEHQCTTCVFHRTLSESGLLQVEDVWITVNNLLRS